MSDARTYEEEIVRLFRATRIHSELAFELGGRMHKVAPFGAGQSPMWSAWSTGQPPLVTDLQTCIYEEAYCRPLGTRVDPPAQTSSLIEMLSNANAGADRWESGWTLAQTLQNGHVLAQKGELAHMFGPGEFRMAQHGHAVPGAALHVLFARESRTQQAGFYIANGDTAAPAGADSRMTRIYWHITEEGAPRLTRSVTTLLNRYAIPFRFKTLSYSGAYTRSDAAVLYFAARYFQVVSRLIPLVRTEVRGALRAPVPLLTRALDDGVGLAEDPGTGESFGMSRSRLIAQAIWDAFVRGAQSDDARMQELAIQFQRHGLSLERPYLRAASADIYDTIEEAA